MPLQKITVAECIETQSKAMTMLTIDQLSYLLKFALQKIKQPGVRLVKIHFNSGLIGVLKSHCLRKYFIFKHRCPGNISRILDIQIVANGSVSFILFYLKKKICLNWTDWAFSEACVAGTAPGLCWVHLPPHGPVYFGEGSIIYFICFVQKMVTECTMKNKKNPTKCSKARHK